MTITDHAAAALALARANCTPPTASDTAHLRRTRAAVTRDVAAMLGVAPSEVVVGEDLVRDYGGQPGLLITVHDRDDTRMVWRFVPETGNTGLGGGAYLLLDECPGCGNRDTGEGQEVPMASISNLADLGLYLEYARLTHSDVPDLEDDGRWPEVPMEFFDDPGHAPGMHRAA